MKDAHFYIYNVGHGVCTLLTGKRDDGITPYCAIFDCGTKAQHDLCEIDLVVDDMKKKIVDSGAEQIDDVVISHQDKDHWSKLLGLFFSLNGIERDEKNGYKNILFGNKGERAWELRNQNGKELYSIWERKLEKHRFATDYSYFAKVMCFSDLKVYYMFADIFLLGGDSAGFHSIITLNKEEGKYVLRMDHRFIVAIDVEYFISVDALVNEIFEWFKYHRITEPVELDYALTDLAESFKLENLSEWIRRLDEETVDITIPIKRVVMGGEMISTGYTVLIALLEEMAAFYSEGGNYFVWPQGGAYVSMSEDKKPKIKINSYIPPEVNLIHFAGGESNVHNLTSAVVEYFIDKDNCLLLPGDVTFHAFQEILGQVSQNGKIKLFLAPHHGSDHSNFKGDIDEPLATLFETLAKNQCNLVISGYNKEEDHPGQRFTKLANRKFLCHPGVTEHRYAYANCELGAGDWTEDDVENSLEITPDLKQRIFTTNVLPFYDEGYYDYCNGEVAIGDMPKPALPCNLKYNGTRRLPPDDCFI